MAKNAVLKSLKLKTKRIFYCALMLKLQNSNVNDNKKKKKIIFFSQNSKKSDYLTCI